MLLFGCVPKSSGKIQLHQHLDKLIEEGNVLRRLRQESKAGLSLHEATAPRLAGFHFAALPVRRVPEAKDSQLLEHHNNIAHTDSKGENG
jgi:hypothetical protein